MSLVMTGVSLLASRLVSPVPGSGSPNASSKRVSGLPFSAALARGERVGKSLPKADLKSAFESDVMDRGAANSVLADDASAEVLKGAASVTVSLAVCVGVGVEGSLAGNVGA